MNETDVLNLAREAITTAMQVAMPLLLFGLVAGVLVSIFQAVTQIQEMTLSFVPKLIAVAVAILLFGPWMLNTLVTFTTNSFTKVPSVTVRR